MYAVHAVRVRVWIQSIKYGLVTFKLPSFSPHARRFHPRATKKVQVLAASALMSGPACSERGLSPSTRYIPLYIQAMEAY